MPFEFNPNELTGKQIVNKPPGFLIDACKLCGLFKKCKSPKMKPYGKNELEILAIGEAPGKDEDEKGIPFIGQAGELLRKAFLEFDIVMDEDCLRTNVIQCRPEKNIFPDDKVEFCYERLEKQIKDSSPKLILCFGQKASTRVINSKVVPGLPSGTFGLCTGDVFPSHKYNAWIALNWHPAYILRDDSLYNNFLDNMEKAFGFLDRKIPESMINSGINAYSDDDIRLLSEYSESKGIVSIDYETNMLFPFREGAELIYISLSNRKDVGYVISLKPKDDKVWEALSKFLRSDVPKIAHNAKFEQLWTQKFFSHEINNVVADTMLSAHIIDERKEKTSLAFQTYLYFGEEYKDLVDRKNIEEADVKSLVKYSSLDARFPIVIKAEQDKILKDRNQEFCAVFLLKGSLALAKMEARGVLIDKKEFDIYEIKIKKDLKKAQDSILKDEFIQKYEKDKHCRLNINSTQKLGKFFFDYLGLEPVSRTEKGNPQVTIEFYESLLGLESDYADLAENFIDYGSIKKINSTYIFQIKNYLTTDNYLHTAFNLNFVETFRSSCSDPSLHTIPKRNESQAEIRKLFIPRHDIFLEVDYKGAEVVVLAMQSDDVELINDIKVGIDFHKYWASRLLKKDEKLVTKKQRDKYGKGGFVFPEFYGSYYRTIAAKLGLSERHVKKIEQEFWKVYHGVKDWQEFKLNEYEEKGYVSTPLGFRRHAPLSRNQIINTPIQATSFHCLLDALIRIEDEWNFESLPILQVHDSILFDCKEREVDYIIELVSECSINKPDWDWAQDVPLSVDWSWGENWLEMFPVGD